MNYQKFLTEAAHVDDLYEIATTNNFRDSCLKECMSMCEGVANLLDTMSGQVYGLVASYRKAARADGNEIGNIRDWIPPAGFAENLFSKLVK